MLFVYDLLGQLTDPCSVSPGYWTTTSSAQSPRGSSSASDASPKHCDSSLKKKELKSHFPSIYSKILLVDIY